MPPSTKFKDTAPLDTINSVLLKLAKPNTLAVAAGIKLVVMAVIRPFAFTTIVGTATAVPKLPTLLLTVASDNTALTLLVPSTAVKVAVASPLKLKSRGVGQVLPSCAGFHFADEMTP